MKRFLITASALLALQVHSCLLAQNKTEIFNPELKIIVENGYLNLFIQLNEIFKWENTKFESIKKFPMRGGSQMPHLIHFIDKGNVTWRQTDVIFTGSYKIYETSAEDLLNQYNEKQIFGFSSWSIGKNQNFKSFNEQTGNYDYLSPKDFANRFNLNYEQDYNKVLALVSGYQEQIVGIYTPQDNLLKFNNEEYAPVFLVPELIVEQSKDMRKWTKANLLDPIPENYLWPEDIKIKIKSKDKENTFYRVKIQEE